MTNIPEPSPGRPDPTPGQPELSTQQAGPEQAATGPPPLSLPEWRKPRTLTPDALIKKIKKALDDGDYSASFIHRNAEKLGDYTPEAVRKIWDNEVKDRLVDDTIEDDIRQLFSYPFQFTHPMRTPETTSTQFLLALKEKCTGDQFRRELYNLRETLRYQEKAYKIIINKPLDSSGHLDCTPEELQRAVKELNELHFSKHYDLMSLNESERLLTRKLMRLLPSQASTVTLHLGLTLHGLNQLESQLKSLEPERKSSDPIDHGPPPPSVQISWIRKDLELVIKELNTLGPEHQTKLPGESSAQPDQPPPGLLDPPSPAAPKEKRTRAKRPRSEPLVAAVRKWMEVTREGFDAFPKWTEGIGHAFQTEREELEKKLQAAKDQEEQQKQVFGKSFASAKEKENKRLLSERLRVVKLTCRIEELSPSPAALEAAFTEAARLIEQEWQKHLPRSFEEREAERAVAEAQWAATATEREAARAAELEKQKAQQAARVAAQKARRARLRDDLLSGKITDPQMIRIWLTPEERVRAHQARMTRGEEKNLQKEKPSDQPPMT